MKLNFEDVEKDIEKWLAKYGRKETLSDGQVCIRGYDSAKTSVLDLYFEARQCRELVSFAQRGYRDSEFIDRLTKLLLEQGKFSLVRSLWSDLTGEQKMSYWSVLAVDRFFPGEDHEGRKFSAQQARERHMTITIPESRTRTLSLLRRYEEILQTLPENECELQSLRQDIELIVSGHLRKKLKRALTETVDEKRFWQLIEESHELKEGVSHPSQRLILLLEQYSGAQIKNFQNILLEKMDALNRWDVWALAYLAQDGCSDDAFEAFRAWVILRGYACFKTVLEDVNTSFSLIPSGQGTACHWLTQCALIAYERRQGRSLSMKKRLSSVQGVPWNEGNIISRFPDLAKCYGRQ